MLAVILESGEPTRLYTAFSLLVSTGVDGEAARGLVSFGALPALLRDDDGGDPALPQGDRGRAAGGRMRRAPALTALLAALTVTGCGYAQPDLFEVQRSGADRNANVNLVVNDGGTVTCNKGKERV